MRFKLIILAVVAALTTYFVQPAQALTLPQSFIKYASSPVLAKPGIILINPATSETLFSNQPDTGRAPASVMKLLSATLASSTLDLSSSFHTSIAAESEPDRYLLTGELDPWLSLSSYEAKKYGAAFAPSLINSAISLSPGAKRIVIDYYGLYEKDLEQLKKYYRGKVYLSINKLPNLASAQEKIVTPIATITSPPIAEILKFTLLWSDNTKADRLAKLGASALGFPAGPIGVQMALEKVLGEMGVSTTGLDIYDGSGLSKDNRVSVRTVAELLVKIKDNPIYSAIYEGLPLAGKSGTLRTRFNEDAPKAVGLVKAKTGWINGTVSLAGYVTVGADEYVFAVIADRITPTESKRHAARVAIDKMLATIAKPKPTI